MTNTLLTERADLVIRQLTLEPGESTPWHTDTCERFTVVVRGESLQIEFANHAEDASEHQTPIEVTVAPGDTGWDAPEPRVHRATNTGTGVYEEVVTFYRRSANIDPQPVETSQSMAGTIGNASL